MHKVSDEPKKTTSSVHIYSNESLVYKYVKKMLDADSRTKIDAHLKSCKECQFRIWVAREAFFPISKTEMERVEKMPSLSVPKLFQAVDKKVGIFEFKFNDHFKTLKKLLKLIFKTPKTEPRATVAVLCLVIVIAIVSVVMLFLNQHPKYTRGLKNNNVINTGENKPFVNEKDRPQISIQVPSNNFNIQNSSAGQTRPKISQNAEAKTNTSTTTYHENKFLSKSTNLLVMNGSSNFEIKKLAPLPVSKARKLKATKTELNYVIKPGYTPPNIFSMSERSSLWISARVVDVESPYVIIDKGTVHGVKEGLLFHQTDRVCVFRVIETEKGFSLAEQVLKTRHLRLKEGGILIAIKESKKISTLGFKN